MVNQQPSFKFKVTQSVNMEQEFKHSPSNVRSVLTPVPVFTSCVSVVSEEKQPLGQLVLLNRCIFFLRKERERGLGKEERGKGRQRHKQRHREGEKQGTGICMHVCMHA